MGGGEALDQLTGDPDDDLRRAEAGHLLGFLERDRTVVDDGRDVGHGPRLHVRQALALAPDATDRAVAVRVDVEDQRLGELGADVQRRARGEGLVAVALPDPTPERHQASVPRRVVIAARASGSPSRLVPLPWAMPGRASASALDGGHRGGDEVPRGDARPDEVVGDGHEQLGLVRVQAERHDAGSERETDVARRGLEGIHRVERIRARDQTDARLHVLGVGDERGGLRDAGGAAGLEAALRLAQLVLQGHDPVRRVLEASGTDGGRGGIEQVGAGAQVGVGPGARQGFDATHPRADAALAGDDEPADLSGGAAMGPAAQFEAVVLDTDRPHGLPVLLVEEGVGPARDRVGHRHERDGDGPVVADDAADLVLDRADLLGRQTALQREVEAQVVRRHERTGLAGAVPDDVPQGPMEQMRARVIAHRVGASRGVDLGGHGLPHPQASVERAAMDDEAAERTLGVGDREQLAAAAGLAQDAEIADLAAALGVERRAIEDDLRLAVAGQLVELHPVADDPDDPAVGRRRLVAEELGVAGPRVDGAIQGGEAGGLRELGLGPGSAPVALLGQGGVEAGPVDADAILGRQFDREVDRKAVGVVQAEGEIAGHGRGTGREVLGAASDDPRLGGQLAQGRLELAGTGVEGPGELRFLAGDGGEDLVPALDEVRVGLAHDLDHRRGGLGHERLATAEEPPVTNGAPQDPAQDVAAALVRRQDVVADEERHGPRVVGDDLVAEPLVLEALRIVSDELAHPGVDRREQVRVVVRGDLLQHARQALQAHPGIDAGERQRDAAVRPLVELHEHEVPDLEPARAVLVVVRGAVRSLGELGTPIEVDLAAGPARPGIGHAPEVLVVAVIDVAPASHPLGRQADLVAPDLPGDLVVLVRRRG